MTNPQKICAQLLISRQQDLTYLTTSSRPSDDITDLFKDLTDPGWQDEIVDDFVARSTNKSYTEGDMARAMEAESFIRDMVTADHINRRERSMAQLQAARQLQELVSDRAPLKKQWNQIGVKVSGPTQEETKVNV